jgi:hypothetical protein
MASVKIRGIQKCFGVTADPALKLGACEPEYERPHLARG